MTFTALRSARLPRPFGLAILAMAALPSAAAAWASPVAVPASVPASVPAFGGGGAAAGQLLQLRCDAAMVATGVIGRTVALHTDGDGRLDLIAKVNDELIWVTAPDPLQHSSTLGIEGVSAYAPFERVGSMIGALIVAHGTGLDYVIRNNEQQRIFYPLRTPVGGAAWIDARSLASADFDGDGDSDIVGLSADGTQLLRLDQSTPEVFIEQPPVDLGVELDELRPIQWGAGSTSLAAILCGSVESACVISVDGTLLRAESFPSTIDDLTVVADGHAQGVDALVSLSGGSITVIRPGSPAEAPVSVAPIAPTSMSAADLDGDGRTDLLLNSTVVDEVTVLLAQDASTTGGQTFVAPNALTAISIPLEQTGSSMVGQMANPVGADFDRDGDIDVFQLIEATRGGCMQRNGIVDETAFKPLVTEFELFPAPGGSLAFVNVDALTMLDGQAPDTLEIVLSTLAQGATLDDEEQHCLRLFHEVGSVTVGTGEDMVTLNIPCELGDMSTLLIRGFREDPITEEVLGVGVEASYRLIRTGGSLQRGSDGPVTAHPGQGGPQGTPPPVPPVLIDPFA
ncbi:MAG: hypothetical protein ACI8WY_002894 [Planctomycetota bacterium]|jgi:hypothetical protein